MKNNFLKITMALALSIMFLPSCKKEYLDTIPSQSTSAEEIFENTTKAYIALNGIHAFMVSDKLMLESGSRVDRDFGAKSADLQSDFMGTDITNVNSGYDWFQNYYNYLAPRNPTNEGYNIWQFYYRIINLSNVILSQIDNAEGPQQEKNDIKGQALAYRAWSYHRLAQRFCKSYSNGANSGAMGVPIYTIPTSGADQGNPRGTLQQVVDQMTADINAAIPLLQDGIVHDDKSHISINTAHGIAARIAMYSGKWADARSHAVAAMSGYDLMTATQLGGGMNDRSNPEFMWCSTLTDAQYLDLGIRTWISFFDESCIGGYAGGTEINRKITKDLYDQISNADRRKTAWFNTDWNQRKFRVKDANSFNFDNLYMRVSEMYLIAAEASAQLNDIGGATTHMQSLLTNRMTSAVTLPTQQAQMLDRIRWERRVELWGEGFGYTDLKERNLPLNRPISPTASGGNHVLSVCLVDHLAAGDNLFTFKIPLGEINANPAIGPEHQNP